jgi:exodeoxyribonuclease V beta subunit
MPINPVHDCKEIDLTRHGLIEASAGTGKTYTIETLVVRILREIEDIHLEDILLVTFTEKATCELKLRIREKLERELEEPGNGPEIARKITGILDTFDQASIFTIHGFCHRVLTDFAFENGIPFQNEVVNDEPIFESSLKEQMRKNWPEVHRENLSEVLGISRFSEKRASFSRTVTRLAKAFHKKAGDRLLPDLRGRDYETIKAEVVEKCLELKGLLGSDGQLSSGFAQLNIHKTTRTRIQEHIVIPVERYFSRVDPGNLDCLSLSDFMTEIQGFQSGHQRGLECLITVRWNRTGPNPEACPLLIPVKKKLDDLVGSLVHLEHCLAVNSIHQLQEDVIGIKRNHGWISYYDLLVLVEEALSGSNASILLERLRKRYRVAFIDEFQDTDPIQWKIFKRIFIDHNEGDCFQNLLFVIGDPKQAIYSFRGADVYAYLSAREEMEMLQRQDKARLYSLSINWRSEPGLISAFNDLFCGEHWFRPQELTAKFEIGYQHACFPDEKKRPEVMISDHSGRPPLNIVDLSDSGSPRLAKLRLAGFVANEIRHLISTDIRFRNRAGVERRVGFRDIAILIRSKSEAGFIEDALSRLKIPHTFYKKPGLFLSDEAYHLSLIFHAILDPGNASKVKRALLTPFFQFGLSDMFSYEDIPPSHAAKQLLFKWGEFASSRRWSLLFHSLMGESGLLSREAGKGDWDRRHTNYQQIFEYLVELAYRKNLDFRTLSASFDQYVTQATYADEEVDIHQIETEAQKVQIMTVHVSKGLQFPVVFVAGGLTQPPSYLDQYHIYHEIEREGESLNAVKMLDLTRMGADRHEGEKADENKRLYYVASTRSQYKLYLPFFPYGGKNQWVGPICRLLSPALSESFPATDHRKNVLWLNPDHHVDASEVATGKEEGERPVTLTPEGICCLFPPQNQFLHRKIRVESFSNLHHRRSISEENEGGGRGFLALRETAREDDEGFASQGTDRVFGEGVLEEMPGGTDVGLMFHGVFEHIDFNAVMKIAGQKGGNAGLLLDVLGTREVIVRQMEFHRVDKRWQDKVCQVIWDTLTTSIPCVDGRFTLGQVRQEERLHEAEFYYPFPFQGIACDEIEGCRISDGLVRGVIDLIFKYGGKIFIADWKSNYIETGYDRESMERNMGLANYHLQYKLYAVAVLRWLKHALGESFVPEKQFGGILYLYLRGMGSGNGNGVYYVPPGELYPLDRLERGISDIIRES